MLLDERHRDLCSDLDFGIETTNSLLYQTLSFPNYRVNKPIVWHGNNIVNQCLINCAYTALYAVLRKEETSINQ